MFKSVRLDHIVLRVDDLEKMITFYLRLLDGVIERKLDVGLVQIRANEVLLDLIPIDSELGRGKGRNLSQGGNLDHFCLRVDPFDEELIKERAIQAGGTPDDVSERYGADGFGPSMYIKDPEGNVIELKGRPVRQLSREC
tara:strand:- start:294 stop:713 length:420 start_codon:yes stop_codon:yes gene_type:complete